MAVSGTRSRGLSQSDTQFESGGQSLCQSLAKFAANFARIQDDSRARKWDLLNFYRFLGFRHYDSVSSGSHWEYLRARAGEGFLTLHDLSCLLLNYDADVFVTV